jgi:hypothetical protein
VRLALPDGEVIGDLSPATEVHLVGCLAFERAVGDPLVVLNHVELDEPPDGREVVALVQEQPAMLEGALSGIDERVREAHVDLREYAMQSVPLEERVHVAVDVLDAGVHEHVRRGHEVTGRLGEHVVRRGTSQR